MRRRSGAIHSESEQQFILLAEKSMNKTGIFYDERLYSQVERMTGDFKLGNQGMGKGEGEGKQGDRKKVDPFAEFDFDEVKEFEKDERDLHLQIEKQLQVNIKYSVICDHDQVPFIASLLANEPEPRTQAREVDLVVRKIHRKDGKCIPLKYWVIDYTIMDTPLASIYLTSSSKIFWAAQGEETKGCQRVGVQGLMAAVAAEEEKYLS